MKPRSITLAPLAALAFVGGSLVSSPAQAAPTQLRVLTYNIWGVPLWSTARAERAQRIGPAVLALKPDVVALEEVWLDEDADTLADALAAGGLIHTRRFGSGGLGGSGLLVASVYPILDASFREFSDGRYPHNPIHLDWIAGKGVGLVDLETPAGVVRFAATHMQSGYRTYDYVFVQLSQALEAADALDSRGEDRPPVIFAGDLNSSWHDLPFRMLASRASLTPTNERCGIDSVLVRAGSKLGVRTLEVNAVLTEDVKLSDGRVMPLSDHPGILAVLELDPDAPPSELATELWMSVVNEALPKVQAERHLRASIMVRDRAAGVALLGVCLLLLGARIRGGYWLRPRSLVAGSALSALAGSWFLYLGLAYGPAHLSALASMEVRLGALAASVHKDVELAEHVSPELAAPPAPSFHAEP